MNLFNGFGRNCDCGCGNNCGGNNCGFGLNFGGDDCCSTILLLLLLCNCGCDFMWILILLMLCGCNDRRNCHDDCGCRN